MIIPRKDSVAGTTDFLVLSDQSAGIGFSGSSYEAQTARSDLKTLQQLRRDAVSAATVKLDDEIALFNALSATAAYSEQLRLLAAKAKIDDTSVARVAFTWASVFSAPVQGHGINAAQTAATSFKLSFEAAAVLFNAGALLSASARALSAGLDPTTPNASSTYPPTVKAACNALLTGAAAFREIKVVHPELVSSTSLDFSAPVLDTLEASLVADAQELFFKKAMFDNMSVSALAKLASGTAETYRRAHGFMNAAGVTNVLPSSWLLLTRAKLGLYEGLTCLNQAKVVATGSGVGKYGLEIAWLRGALDAFTKVHVEVFNGSDNIALRFLKGIAGVMDVANSDSEVSESLKKVKLDVIVNMEAVKQLLTLAEKDNDVVYMEVVPPLATLLCPTAAVMVKPDLAPLYDIYITNKLPPLFQTLTPLYIRQSQERYTKARTEYLQPLAELSNATTSCRADLAAANLPTSIESLSKPDSQILHEMHAAVAGLSNPPGASLAETLYGARAALLAKRDVVQTLLKRAGEALDAEAAMDAEARQAFAGRWTRLESAQLTKGLREAVRGYADKLDAAAASDAVVLGKVDGNGERLALLGDENLLKVLIRGGGGGGAEAGGGVSEEAMRVEEVIKLKGALALLNEVISKRDKLCADVDALIAVDDITPKLLEASNGVFINNEQDIYAASLQKYEPFVAMSRASQKSQNDIVTLIKSRNAKFVDWTKTNERLAKRNEFVADHARGIEMFKEIMSNFAAGLAFYSQFEPILNKFLVNCQDYCMTRGIEKADLLEELQRTSLQSQPQYDPNNINFSFNPNPPPSVPPPFRNP